MTDSDALTQQTRNILVWVLGQADFPGVEELRTQAAKIGVCGGPVTMLALQVPGESAPSEFTAGPIPFSVSVTDAAEQVIGELLLWIEDGYLSALEYAWLSDEPPDRLPDPGQLRVIRR
jgi:hypothetical protein